MTQTDLSIYVIENYFGYVFLFVCYFAPTEIGNKTLWPPMF